MSETSPTGGDAPARPTFDAIPLSADLRRAIDAMEYKHPTPVQLAVFDPAVRGKNLVVQARTGTGKTAAFGLPILDQLVRKSQPNVQALILTPTRELALQVARELEKLAQFRGTQIVAIYGGAPMQRQIDALDAGAQIVVGTPGRVLDHIRRGTLKTGSIRIFVLDEADEMLSMGFAKELNAIAEALPKDRQGLFFSATIPPDIERLAVSHLKEPEFVTLSSDQVGALEIRHFVYVVRDDKKQALLRVIEVENPESAVVFCNTKDETQRVAETLQNKGFDADWLNGDLPQSDRERVMQKTREGKLRFLVATDVAARGIDISHLTHVINYDFPESAEQYVHRTGRTGRAGRTGTAIALVGPKDIGNLYILRLTYKIRPIEKLLPSQGELKTRQELDVVQLFEDAFGNRPMHPDDLALARRLMTHFDAEKIIAGLVRDHLGARPDAVQEAAEARRAKNPAPLHEPSPRESDESEAKPAKAPERREPRTDPRRERDRERRPRGESRDRPRRGVPHKEYAKWEPPEEQDDDKPILPSFTVDGESEPQTETKLVSMPEPPPQEPEGFVRLFVNVGRREGAKPSDIQALLETNAGIAQADTGAIRVRDRMTFVSIRKELVEKAIAALSGQVIGGRTVVAELARTR